MNKETKTRKISRGKKTFLKDVQLFIDPFGLLLICMKIGFIRNNQKKI